MFLKNYPCQIHSNKKITSEETIMLIRIHITVNYNYTIITVKEFCVYLSKTSITEPPKLPVTADNDNCYNMHG